MPQLILVRHGIAEDPAPGQADADRALTQRGRDRVTAVAGTLATLLGPVDRRVSSRLLRARQTADLLAEALSPSERAEFPGLAPQGAPREVYTWLNGEPAVETTMLVGHEPQMNLLLGLALTGETVGLARFRKAGVAVVEFPGIPEPGAGRLEAFLPPAVSAG